MKYSADSKKNTIAIIKLPEETTQALYPNSWLGWNAKIPIIAALSATKIDNEAILAWAALILLSRPWISFLASKLCLSKTTQDYCLSVCACEIKHIPCAFHKLRYSTAKYIIVQEVYKSGTNGMASFLEKKAQQEMMKRAIDAAWVATTCIGMVIAPLVVATEMGGSKIAKSDLNKAIDTMVLQWRFDVQRLSDRNIDRNREYYAVQPNLILSPILDRFAYALQSIQAAPPSVEAAQMIQALKEAYTSAVKELLDFFQWSKSSEVHSLIDFDAAKYEPQAVRKAQNYWKPTVNEIKKMLG
jgi:hypothetical protein